MRQRTGRLPTPDRGVTRRAALRVFAGTLGLGVLATGCSACDEDDSVGALALARPGSRACKGEEASSGATAAGAAASATAAVGVAGAEGLGSAFMTGASKLMSSAFRGGPPGLMVTPSPASL